jgi:hypothetical protein
LVVVGSSRSASGVGVMASWTRWAALRVAWAARVAWARKAAATSYAPVCRSAGGLGGGLPPLGEPLARA